MRESFRKAKKLAAIIMRPPLWIKLARRTAPSIEHLKVLREIDVGTCIDVGANRGQFSSIVRYCFPRCSIIAFEPLHDAAVRYQKVIGARAILHQCALGDRSEKALLRRTRRADSSSLLSPVDGPASRVGIVEDSVSEVDVRRLPELVDLSVCTRPLLLKVDVQGGELDLFRGCGDALRQVDWIYAELSYLPLYQGQPLASEVVTFLNTVGFELRGMFNQSSIVGLGIAQADFLFARRSAKK